MALSIEEKPLAGVTAIIAATAAFQSLTASANATDAAEYVHTLQADDNGDNPRPRCVVDTGDTFVHERIGVQGEYADTGDAEITFEIPADPALTVKQQMLSVLNTAGDIVSQCDALAGLGTASSGETYINIVRWTRIGRPERVNEQHENGESFWVVKYRVEWQG